MFSLDRRESTKYESLEDAENCIEKIKDLVKSKKYFNENVTLKVLQI